MKINFIKKTLLLFALSLAIISCDRDDQVGDSQLTPTTPAVTISLDFTDPITTVENDSEYDFYITMSDVQIVDTKLYVEQVGGDADHDDYEVTGLIVIPAGYTTGMGTIKILEDELIEDTETLALQIGDIRTANSSMTPVTANFTITNLTAGDLVVGLNWAASEPVFDDEGEEISATDLADMRLIIAYPDGTPAIIEDGGSFEEAVFLEGYPDGDWLVMADFYDAMEFPTRKLNLQATFDQVGTINGMTLDFDAAINSAFVCPENFYTLASFTKTGSMYSIMEIGQDNALNPAGDWTLEMNDSWGDGWDGAYLTVSINGEDTDYTCVGPQTIEMITGVPDGAEFIITYTAGDYEEEHSYIITAPDGTVYSDGPNPTVGVVIDSGNVCP